MVTDIYLLLMLFSLLALVIFFFSMLIRLIKGEDWKEEGKRSFIFFVFAGIFFILFGLTIS